MSKKFIFIITIFILTILGGVLVFYWLIFFPKELLFQEGKVFSIEKGQGSKEIALNLEKEELIRWAPSFRAYVLLNGTARNLKAGEYLLSSSMSIPQIAGKFSQGEVQREMITIIEGWNLGNIGLYFEEKGIFQAKEFWQVAGFPLVKEDFSKRKDFSQEFNFLKDKPENLNLEGYLFPDTYQITGKEDPEIITKRMLANFDKKLSFEMREKIESQGKSIFEIITMASILEKEVRTLEDKKIVSGIFWKKINHKEPLYSCATIAYVLGDDAWGFDEMRKEIALAREIDSPYNTYRYKGLPLGPISNPGLESIIAAIEPEESDFWYFLSTKEGKTIFSRNLQEHNVAKAIYFGK